MIPYTLDDRTAGYGYALLSIVEMSANGIGAVLAGHFYLTDPALPMAISILISPIVIAASPPFPTQRAPPPENAHDITATNCMDRNLNFVSVSGCLALRSALGVPEDYWFRSWSRTLFSRCHTDLRY